MNTITTTICPKIDIHSHLIYNIDDGSDSIETTLEALEDIKKIGVKKILCTPHFDSLNNKDIKNNFEKIKGLFQKENIDLELGFEFKLNYKNINELKKIKYNNQYILVELDRYENLPFDIVIEQLDEIMDLGYKIVLAHPEFYNNYRKIKYINKLKENNIIIQIDATSLLKKFTNFKIYRFTKKLLKKGLVDVVASDYHDNKNRNYKRFEQAYDLIKSKYGSDKAKQLFYENPLVIINNFK